LTTYNDESVISKTLRALIENLSELGEHSEVIIVDGGSSDKTLELALSFMRDHGHPPFGLKVIQHATNLGVSRARNDGLLSASCDLSLVLDSDVVLPRGALRLMTEYLLQQESLGNRVAVKPLLTTVSPFYFKLVCGRIARFSQAASEALLIRTDIARSVKYNESIGPPFTGDEDSEFAARLLANGVRVHTLGNVVAVHEKPPDSLYVATAPSALDKAKRALRIFGSYFEDRVQRGFAIFFRSLLSAGMEVAAPWIISPLVLVFFALSLVSLHMLVAAVVALAAYVYYLKRTVLDLQPPLQLRDAPYLLGYIFTSLVNRSLRMLSLAVYCGKSALRAVRGGGRRACPI